MPSYSYCESIAPYYGTTGNAAADNALYWTMQDVLPDPIGLEIDNVIYSYRIQKETGEHVDVYVYNENAFATGYIFREHDEWKPGSLSGTEINKVVPLGRVHRDLFGPGGIEVDGPGSVYDTSVIYTYRVDPCYNPQYDPNCPGYVVPKVEVVEYEIYDAYDEGHSDQADYDPNEEEYEEEEELSEEELVKLEDEEERDREDRLEKALFEAGRAELFAQALAQSQMQAISQINMNTYYNVSIPGGVYLEVNSLQDGRLPDAKSGLRNGLAQQLLHQQMVEMQYNRN